jgi:hypothetical protein
MGSAHVVPASIRIADDELPSSVGLAPKDLDSPGTKLDCLSRAIDRGAIKVGIE